MGISTQIRTYLIVVAGLCGLATAAMAAETRYFSIGTGSTAGTYFPVGSLIAAAISRPVGSSPCDQGGACGVENLIATAVTSRGSIDNIQGIAEQRFNSGLAQADVVAWAHAGEEIFKSRGSFPELRAIANLYPEHVHVVARKDLNVATISDLKGLRVAIDRVGSGTRINAMRILNAYGIRHADIQPISAAPEATIASLLDGHADAAFFVVGYPSAAVEELTETGEFTLVPIAGAAMERMLIDNGYYARGTIPAGIYGQTEGVETVTVGAQWVTHQDVPEELVYEITTALWRAENQALLHSGHAKGKALSLETAVQGVTIPFHPGAARFYAEQAEEAEEE